MSIEGIVSDEICKELVKPKHFVTQVTQLGIKLTF